MDYEKIEKNARLRDRVRKTITYFFLTVWGILVLFPFYWMVLTSVKSYGAYNSEWIPKLYTLSPTLQNYVDAFTQVPLGGYFLNTIVFTVITTGLMLIVTVLAAYGFARLNFKGKDLVFALFLSLMMIPTELVVITNFVTITDLNLRNTFTGLILPSVTSVFYIYLLKETFSQVPDELYYAAKVDGTSDLKYLFKVMIPICRPTVVTITILKGHRVLELLRLAAADYRRSVLFSGVQRHSGDSGKRLWPGEHPRHDGGGGGHFPAADRSVPDFPEEDHGGRFERRREGMKRAACFAACPCADPCLHQLPRYAGLRGGSRRFQFLSGSR